MTDPKNDLPTAARALANVGALGRSIMENPDLNESLKEGDELVRLKDAEDFAVEKMSDGVAAGKKEERERVLGLIDQRKEKLEGLVGVASERSVHELEELRQEVGQS